MFRKVFVALAFGLPVACNAAPTEGDFTRDMLDHFRAKTPGEEMRIKEDEPLVIQIKRDGEWGVLNLHRIFGYCQNVSASDCEAAKSEFTTKIGIRPPSARREMLRLIVRDQTYVDYLEQSFKDLTQRPPYRSIGEGVYAIVAVDAPDTIQLATQPVLQELGLQPSEAWDIAARQTRAMLPEVPLNGLRRGEAVAFQDQEYLASLLADTERWKSIAAEIGPDLFVTAVADKFVFVGTMPSGLRLDAFKKTVDDDCRTQERCVLPYVYRFRDGRWVVAD